MARPCTVCTHANRNEIDKMLVNSESCRVIAGQFHVSRAALQRHKADHLPEALAKAENARAIAGALVDAKEAQEIADATNVMGELLTFSKRAVLLYDACDRWLRDPDDPTRYDIGARAEDIDVTFFEKNGDDKPLKRKAKLSDLLERAKIGIGSGLDYGLIETKHADPRELILKTFDRLKAHLELLAEMQGKLNRNPQINVTFSPEWVGLRTTILNALADFPEARQAIAKVLSDGNAAN